jgi:hypothetical protein
MDFIFVLSKPKKKKENEEKIKASENANEAKMYVNIGEFWYK